MSAADDRTPFMNTQRCPYSCYSPYIGLCRSRISDQTARRRQSRYYCVDGIMKRSGFSSSFHLLPAKSMMICLLCLLFSLFHGAWGQTNTNILNPKITAYTSTVEFVNGEEYTLLCSMTVATSLAAGALSPFTWSRASDPLPADVEIVHALPLILNETTTYESRLTFVATPNDNARPIRCSAVLGIYTGSGTYTPSLIIPPNEPIVTGPSQIRAGEEATWTCVSDGASIKKPNVFFRDGDGNSLAGLDVEQSTIIDTLEYQNNIYEVTYKLTMTIPPTSPTYTLTCYVVHDTSSYKAERETSFTISVLFPPQVTKTGSNDVLATEFTTVTLSCLVSASPPDFTVSWSKDGVSINLSSSRFTGSTKDFPSLVISNLQKSDLGNYTCSATSVEGTGSFARPTSLIIRYTPVITYTQTSFDGGLGGSITLPCPADAVPDVSTIRWKRVLNGVTSTIRPDLNNTYSGVDPSTKSYGLTINPLTVSDGDGEYFCEADNDVSTGIGTRITLVVNERPVIQPAVVSIITAVENGQFTLQCDVTPLDSLTDVYWTRNGQRLITSTDSTKYFGGTRPNPSLIVFRATDSDVGSYRCVVSNPYGTSISDVITVTLNFRPRLTVPNTSIAAQRESSIFLSCSVSANPPVTTLYWTKNGATISATSEPSKYNGGNKDDPSLIIFSASALDDGQYTCVASNDVGVSFSSAVSVTVTGAPLVTVTPAFATVEEGVAFYTFVCEVIASPGATDVYWTFNGNRVSSGFKYSGGTISIPNLTIRSVSRDDSGSYSCVATNSQGTSFSVPAEMNVIYRPTVTTTGATSITQQVGNTVTISCTVSANPEITDLYWLKDGTVLSTTDITKYSGGTTSRPSLTIFDLKTPSDSGQYSCVATNSRGSGVSQAVQLTVTSQPVIDPVTDPVEAVENQDLVVPCNVSPLDSLTGISWLKDGSPLDTSDSGKYAGGDTNSPSLIIKSATDSDAGDYQCVATNAFGNQTGPAVTVTLNYIPRVTVPSSSLTLKAGSDVLLPCAVDAHPNETEVYWRQNGAGQLTSTTNSVKYEGGTVSVPSLTIRNANLPDSGNYQCVAVNAVGQGTSGALVVSIEGTPLPSITPLNPEATEGDENLVLTCSFLTNPPADDLYWTKDGVRISDDPDKYSGGTLDIPNLTIRIVDPLDRGSYRCIVMNPEGAGISSPVLLTVIYKPILTVTDEDVNTSPGSDLTLLCLVDANPLATDVYWIKEGQGRIDSAANPTKYRNGNLNSASLVVLDTVVADSGVYTCVAVNDQGTTNSSDVNVFVRAIPIVNAVQPGSSVDEGEEVTLTCSYLSVPDAEEVYWTKGGSRVDVVGPTSRYQGSEVDFPSLVILSIQPDDSGTYVCNVVNRLGTGFSASVTLEVRYAPVITPVSGEINRPIGSTVTLTCSVEANPPPTSLYWVKVGEGRIMTPSGRYSGGDAANPSLVISDAETSDTGDYYCVVGNDLGNTTSDPVTLSVVGVPRVTATGPDSHVTENDTVTLACTFESVPAAENVYWTKDGTEVDVAGQPSKFSGSSVDDPDLTILDLQASDLGSYICYVVNSVDTGASNSVALNVWYTPILTVSDRPVSDGPGNDVTLTCDVQSNPEPTQVYWTKTGRGKLSSASSPDEYAFGNLDNANLVILDADISDTGTYRCVVVNLVGTQESDPVSVSITSIPVVTSTPLLRAVEEGSASVRLNCSYQAVPDAEEVYWRKDDIRIDLASQPSKYVGSSLSNPSLTIFNVEQEDDGSYVCYVENSIGPGFSQPIVLDVSYAPVLTVQTESVNQNPGTLLTLTCRVDANPEVTQLYWTKVGTGRISSTLDPSRYTGGNTDNPNLGILSPQTSDTGVYTCVAFNAVGNTTSDPVNVFIISIPSVTSVSPASSIDENQTVILNCSYLAVPPATSVFWTKEGAQVDILGQPDKYSGSTIDTASLTIISLEASDQGSYICNVMNDIGTGSSSAVQLEVNYQPILTVAAQAISQRPGNTVILICTIDSNPLPDDVYWTKTGPGRIVPASNPSKYSGGSTSEPNLQIRSTTSADTGSYACVAANRLGTTTSNLVSVTIINVPSVTANTSSTSVSDGSTNVLLTCTYVSNPPATDLYWTKDGALIDSATFPLLYIGGTFDSQDLTLQTISRDSEGSYVCNVVNSLGTGASSAIELDVTYLPVITVPSDPVTGSPGSSVTLNAQIDSNPPPLDVYWTKVGQGRIDSTANPTKYNGGDLNQYSLTILLTAIGDTGTYTLTVENDLGTTVSEAVSVSIENVPVVVVSPPTSTVSNATTNVIFTCSHQANPSPTRIYWTKDGEEVVSDGRFVNGNLDIPNLTILLVLREDAGVYVCNVVNSVGTGTSTNVLLDVLYQPILTVTDQPITNSPGATVMLTCQVDANPEETQVFWTKTGQGPISSTVSPSKYVGGDKDTPTLQILDASIDDSATYFCSAVNSEGLSQSNLVSVDIVNTPTVTAASSATTVDEGSQNILFTCNYQANPVAIDLYWTKDGDVIDPTSNPDKYSGGIFGESTLTIKTVDRNDGGDFVCNVVNSIGTGRSLPVSFNVTFPPSFVTSNETIIGAKGADVTLTCDVTANPEVTSFHWTKDGTQINLAEPPGKYAGGTITEPDLTITNLNETSDVASYVCVATNGKGTTNSQPVQLRVTFDPVVTTPSSLVGRELEALTITCTVQMFPEATEITWYKDNVQLNVLGNQDKYAGGVPINPSLVIISVAVDDAGVYRCEANNGQTPVSSDNTQVTVLYAPKITTQATVEANLGDPAILQCFVSANPSNVTVQWQVINSFGTPVNVDESQPEFSGGTSDTPSLTILRTKAEDAGEYTCVVTNSEGTTSSNPIDLSIRYAPTNVTISSDKLTLDAGESYTLSCTSDGYPTPTFSWTRNGNDINNSGSSLIRVSTSDDNNAQFTCTATNVIGSSSDSLTLNVQYPPEPTVAIPQNLTSPPGGQETLTCAVQANPPPITYEWYKGGNKIDGETDQTLVVTFATDADFGSYSCAATNPKGTQNPAVTFQVTKQNTPVLPSNVIVSSSPPPPLVANTNFTLTCQADGFPVPSYTWERQSTTVSTSFTTVSLSSTYTRTAEPEDNTLFRCTASNSQGSALANFNMDVRFAPVPTDTGVRVRTARTDTTVLLTCDVNANPAVTSYVWYKGADEISGQTGQTLSVTVSGSSELGSYTCSAENDIGRTDQATQYRIDNAPDSGASTNDSGISTTTIILIVVIIIILIVILILVIIFCCQGKCSRKKENSRVSPAASPVPKPYDGYMNGTGHFGPPIPSSSTEKLRIHEGEPDYMKPAVVGAGPIISLPERQGPRAHHLPPLSQDTPVVENYYREEKRRSRKKKRRRRVDEKSNLTNAEETENNDNAYINTSGNNVPNGNIYEEV